MKEEVLYWGDVNIQTVVSLENGWGPHHLLIFLGQDCQKHLPSIQTQLNTQQKLEEKGHVELQTSDSLELRDVD